MRGIEWNKLPKDCRRVIKYAQLSPSSFTFLVPPPYALSSLRDEVWHRAEPYANPETWTYVVKFWSDNGDNFMLNTGQIYRLPLL